MTVETLLLAALSTLAAVILANHSGLWVSGREHRAVVKERDVYLRMTLRLLHVNDAAIRGRDDELNDDGRDSDRVA